MVDGVGKVRLAGFRLGLVLGSFSGLENPGGKGRYWQGEQDHGLSLGHAEFEMPVTY